MSTTEQTFSRRGNPKKKSAEKKLECPKTKNSSEKSRRHLLKNAHIVCVHKNPMFKLKRVRKKMEKETLDYPALHSRKEEEVVPSVKVTKSKRRVAEIALTKGQFYNPALAISKAIRDSLNPEKVLASMPAPVTVIKEAEGGEGRGFKIHIKAVLEEREKAKLYRLPSGWDMWIPKRCLLEEGRYFIRIPARLRWGLKALRLPPKFRTGLTKEQVKARLLAKLKERRGT